MKGAVGMRGILRWAVFLLTALGGVARGQVLEPATPPLSFDTAIVRTSDPNATDRRFNITEDSFSATGMQLGTLVRFAFRVRSRTELSGLPDWANHERFDVSGKVSAEEARTMRLLAPEDRIVTWRRRLQTLLAERFGLQVVMQSRQAAVLELVQAKKRAGLGPSLGEEKTFPTVELQPGRAVFGKSSMAWFTDWLATEPVANGRPIVDRTGLSGNYSFQLEWTPGEGQDGEQETAASMTAALKDQLGLELRPGTAAIQVLVIQHLERPSDP